MTQRKYEIVSTPALTALIRAAESVARTVDTNDEHGREVYKAFYTALVDFNNTREDDWWRGV